MKTTTKSSNYLSLISAFALFILTLGTAQAQDSVYHRVKIWENDMARFAKDDKENPNKNNPVLFVGSSSFTRWYHLDKYFPESNVLNRGFGGTVLADVIYYFNDVIYKHKPSQVIIYGGDNDIAGGMPPEVYLSELKTLVRLIEIHLPGVPVVVLSTKSSPARDNARKYYERSNALVYEYCMKTPHLTYVDVYSLLLDAQGNYRSDLFVEDNIHITDEAYKLWGDRLRPHLLTR